MTSDGQPTDLRREVSSASLSRATSTRMCASRHRNGCGQAWSTLGRRRGSKVRSERSCRVGVMPAPSCFTAGPGTHSRLARRALWVHSASICSVAHCRTLPLVEPLLAHTVRPSTLRPLTVTGPRRRGWPAGRRLKAGYGRAHRCLW